MPPRRRSEDLFQESFTRRTPFFEVSQACPTIRRRHGRPRTHGRDEGSVQAWECLKVLLDDMEEVPSETVKPATQLLKENKIKKT